MYNLLGCSHPDELIGHSPFDRLVSVSKADILKRITSECETGMPAIPLEHGFLRMDGSIVPVEVSAVAIQYNNKESHLVFVRNIEDRKRKEKELKEALVNIKQLSGLLPICASCKKIRDDKGYWKQLEWYITEHSTAEFSHSICPECVKKLYPEFTEEDN